jgi:tetratricopeptide (TPR) repeat protein
LGLPVSIREVIGRRVARLGPEAERVLSLAAVIGRDFDLSLLAPVVDLDEGTLIDLCDTAVSAAVLAESDMAGRYAFAHALIERTLYDGLSGSRRAQAHRTIAEALEELCGDEPGARIGELAYHWVHATQPQDSAKAIAYAQRAGDRALEQLAPDEARRWYRDALDLLDRAPHDDPRRRAELLLGLGDAQRQTGDPANRETLLTAARLADRIDAIDILVRAALRNTRGYASSTGVVDREAVEILTLALTRLGERDSPDRARLLALRCLEGSYDADFDERLTIATEAVDMARRTGDTAALVDAIRHGITAIAAPQTLELRLQWIVEACDLADHLGDPAARHHTYLLRTETALEAGDLATMRTATARFEAEGERLGQPLYRWMKAYTRAVRHMLEGDLGAAEQSATEALTLGIEAAQPDAAAIYGVQLLGVRWQQGRLVEMVPLIQQAVLDIPGQPGYRAALVWAKSHDGQSREVKQLLDAEVADGLPMLVHDVGLTIDVLWAETASRVGHRPAATMLHQRLLPWAEQIASTNITVTPGVAHYLGLLAHVLGRHDEADQWFAQALALHERMESRFFVGLTQIAWAALLADRNQPGDAQRARLLLDAALPVATAGGYGYIEHDARALLKRID